MTNTVDTKPETKTMNTVEAYNEGFLHGVSFCKKYGIPSETTSTTPIEDKGWEILTWFSREGEVALLVCGEIEGNLYAGYKIRSVRRTSDNEVFTVGDYINKGYGTIKSFQLHRGNNKIMCVVTDKNDLITELNHLKKEPQDKGNVLFTEDGVQIKDKRQLVYHVTDDFKITFSHASTGGIPGRNFSSPEAAEQYILENKPCLSLFDCDIDMPEYLFNQLKEKAKQKLNQ